MFPGTKTPLKPTDSRKRKFVVPMVPGVGNTLTYRLTEEQEAAFRKYWPIRFNKDIMEMFGLSDSTVHRLARELGLKKNMKVIARKHTEQSYRTCIDNGYYASIKGKRPSDACYEAYRRKCQEGYHPLKAMKENHPRKYKELCRRRSEDRKELIAKERRRMDIGLPQRSRLHVPVYKYTRSQVNQRRNAQLKYGYVVGDMHEFSGERWTIYYTSETKRSSRFEKNLNKNGFAIKELAIHKRSRNTTDMIHFQ